MVILTQLNSLHWIASLILFFQTAHCLKYRTLPVGRALSIFLFLAGCWALLAAFISLVPDFETMVLLNRFKMAFVAFIPVSILYLAVSLSPSTKLSRWFWGANLIVPIFSVLITLSSYHELFINNYHTYPLDGMLLLAYDNGPWFAIHGFAARVTILFAVIFIYRNLKGMHNYHRFSAYLFMIGIMIPAIIDIIAVHYYEVLRYIQIVPAVLPILGIIFLYAIFEHRTLDVIPTARSELINHMPDPCLMWSERSNLVDFNQAASNLFGITDQHIGKHIDFVLAEYPQIKIEEEFKSADGQFYQILQKDILEKGKFKGSFHILRNITDQKTVEKELRNIAQVKTTFLGILSHDLVGSVSNIALLSEVLVRDYQKFTNQEAKPLLESIQHEAHEINTFISELLQWAKSQMTQIHPKKDEVNLSSLVKKSTDFLRPLMIEKDIEINLDLPHEETVPLDKNMIETVVRNIIANAIKFAPQGGNISIKLKSDDQMVNLSIEDSGQHLDLVAINRFLQSSQTTMAPKDFHFGLGLLLSREFISLHQGDLWAEKSEEGSSVFSFTLPKQLS